jgi:hypothetical protein
MMSMGMGIHAYGTYEQAWGHLVALEYGVGLTKDFNSNGQVQHSNMDIGLREYLFYTHKCNMQRQCGSKLH